MGQFHNDFAHSQIGQIDKKEANKFEAVSKRCIILGKKCYLDIVTIIDKKTGMEAKTIPINK